MLRKVTRDYIINNVGKPIMELQTSSLGNINEYYYLIKGIEINDNDETVTLIDTDGDKEYVDANKMNNYYVVV